MRLDPEAAKLLKAGGHERFMDMALKQAALAEKDDEVPVGAVLVKDGKVIARGRNAIRRLKDPVQHAEMRVLRQAARRLNRERLNATILYTTLEPCAMCAGAIVLARVSLVVYGARDPRAGAGGTLFNVLQHPQLNHRCGVLPDVCEQACREILQHFFRRKRGKPFDS